MLNFTIFHSFSPHSSKPSSFFFSKIKKRQIFLSLLLFFCLGAGIYCYKNNDNLKYEHFCRNVFHQEMEGNTLTLHYTLLKPWRYGLFHREIGLPTYSKEVQTSGSDNLRDWQKVLGMIDPQKLSPSNAYSYHLVERMFSLQSDLNQYPYLEEPLSPANGVHQSLPTLLSEYRFSSIKDIDDYLQLLTCIPDYLEGILTFEKEKQEAGFFMADTTADTVIKQCQTIFSLSEIEEGSHFLLTSFATRLNDYEEKHPLFRLAQKKADYLDRNQEILATLVFPAYQHMAEELAVLAEKNQGTESATLHGLGHYEQGKDYYEALVRKYTGSYRSMVEIQDMLFNSFEACSKEYQMIRKNKAVSVDQVNTPASVNNKKALNVPASKEDLTSLSASEILENLQEQIKKEFPAIPQPVFSKKESVCLVKEVSAKLAEHSAPAFYLMPPIDACNENVIYVNPASHLSGLSLFTTLAHEGFPGHLYQTVYCQKNHLFSPRNPLRGILNYEGYCEGWAFYTELKSYDFAKQLFHVDVSKEQLSRELELALCAILDYHIHYTDMTLEKTQALLGGFGISKDRAKSIYTYIVQEPGIYLKYYLSYLEILSLKEEAKALWKEGYSDFAFHKFFLEAGPSDFASLRDLLEEKVCKKRF